MWHAWRRTVTNTRFWWRNMKEKDHAENLGTDRRIIRKSILRNRIGGMNWIYVTQNRNQFLYMWITYLFTHIWTPEERQYWYF
jgi:hypothetical protein